MIKAENSLVNIILMRIFFFSLLAMTYQLAFLFFRYWSDTERIERLLVVQEAKDLSRGLIQDNGETKYYLPQNLKYRYANNDDYFTQIRLEEKILYSNCKTLCDKYFLPLQSTLPDFWLNEFPNYTPLRIAGGKQEHFFGKNIIIEFAIVKDSQNRLMVALVSEVGRALLIPMILMTVFVMGAMSFSIIHALRPIERAAKLLENIETPTGYTNLKIENMPKEINSFMNAVNNAFSKLEDLIRKQKVFTTAISHEVRTPLAVCRLELEKISDPAARKVEQDLMALSQLVTQLTDLARIDAVGAMITEKVNPNALAERVVSDLAPMAYDSGKSLSLEDKKGVVFRGHPTLIENAIRNLVENAIKHSGPSASIIVEVGPGRELAVIDDGGHRAANKNTSPAVRKTGDRGEFGLKIVSRIAELHGAKFELKSKPNEGTSARIIFKT